MNNYLKYSFQSFLNILLMGVQRIWSTSYPDIKTKMYKASEYDFDSVDEPERQFNIDDRYSKHNQLSEQFLTSRL